MDENENDFEEYRDDDFDGGSDNADANHENLHDEDETVEVDPESGDRELQADPSLDLTVSLLINGKLFVLAESGQKGMCTLCPKGSSPHISKGACSTANRGSGMTRHLVSVWQF